MLSRFVLRLWVLYGRGVSMIIGGVRRGESFPWFFTIFAIFSFPFFSSLPLPSLVPDAHSQIGTELGSEDDLTVLGTDGNVHDPDLEIKGFTIFGSTDVRTHISTAPGNTIFNGAIETSSDVYVTGRSTFAGNVYFPSAGALFVSDGASGQILRKNVGGWLYWDNVSAVWDNLGNHVATTTLNMNSWNMVNVSSVNFLSNVYIASATAAQYGGVYISSNVYVVGQASIAGAASIGGQTNSTFFGYSNAIRASGSETGSNVTVSAQGGGHFATGGTLTLTAGNAFDTGSVGGNVILQSGFGFPPSPGYIAMQTYQGTYPSQTLAERLRIVGYSGNVGIGTTNPTHKLRVEGGVLATSSITASGDISGARYMINGSTVLAILPGSGSFAVGMDLSTGSTGDYNLFIGSSAGRKNATGYANTFLGNTAGYTNGSGYDNTFLGYQTGFSNTTGHSNTVLGAQAGYYNTTGAGNSFVGRLAGYNNAAGGSNTFIGFNAGRTNVDGSHNTYVGYWSGYNTTGNTNSFLGSQAGYNNTTGGNNSMVGRTAGYYTQTGSANAIFGSEAGFGASGQSFSSSTLVGYKTGYGLTTGSNNILVGFQAGYNIQAGSDNIVIGYNELTSAIGASNELNIGGVIYGDLFNKTVGISTRVPQAALDIVSTGTASNVYAQIWRNSSGVIKASMTADGTLYTTVSPPMDNLGNHVATTTLNMNTWNMINVSSVNFKSNVYISSASAAQYGGVYISSDVYIAGSKVYLNTSEIWGGSTFQVRQGGSAVFYLGSSASIGGNLKGGYGVTLGGGSYGGGIAANDRLTIYGSGTDLFSIYDGSVKRFSVIGGGNVGIGTTAPAANLHISSTTAIASQDMIKITTGTTAADVFVVKGSGKIGIGTTNPTHKLGVDGDILATSSITANGNISGARYMINGSTVLAILGGIGSFAVGPGISADSTGDYNLFVGSSSGRSNTTGMRNSFIGFNAGRVNSTGVNDTFLGFNAGWNNTTASSNTLVGASVGYNLTTGLANSFLGYGAGYSGTAVNFDTFLGYMAGYGNTGGNNTFVGTYSGQASGSAAYNAFLGMYSGYTNTSGAYNTFIGYAAGYANSSGKENTFMGNTAGYAGGVAGDNTLIGYAAGRYITTGSTNTIVGHKAAFFTQTGSANTILGNEAGYGATGNSFSSSTIIGYHAGYGLTTGSDNLLLGFKAGYNITSGTGNIIIGYNEAAPAAATSNHLSIGGIIDGDLVAGNVGIGTTNPAYSLEIQSSV